MDGWMDGWMDSTLMFVCVCLFPRIIHLSPSILPKIDVMTTHSHQCPSVRRVYTVDKAAWRSQWGGRGHGYKYTSSPY